MLKNDHSSSIHTTLKILNPHLQKSLLPLSPNQQPLIGKSFDGKFDEFPNKNLSNSKFTIVSKTTHFHPIFTPSNLPNHKIPNKNYPLTNPHYFYQKQLISHFKIQPLSHHKTPCISSKNHFEFISLTFFHRTNIFNT